MSAGSARSAIGKASRWGRQETDVRSFSGRSFALAERAMVSAFALVALNGVPGGVADARHEPSQEPSQTVAADRVSRPPIPGRIHLVSQDYRIYVKPEWPWANLAVALYRSHLAHLAAGQGRPVGGGDFDKHSEKAKHKHQREPLLIDGSDLPVYLAVVLQCHWPTDRSNSRSAPTLSRMFAVDLEIDSSVDLRKATRLPRALVVKMAAQSGYGAALVGHLHREGGQERAQGQQIWTLTLEPRFFEIVKHELDHLDRQVRTQLAAELAQTNGDLVPIDRLPSVASDKHDFIGTHKRHVTLKGTAIYAHQGGSLIASPGRRNRKEQVPPISTALRQ